MIYSRIDREKLEMEIYMHFREENKSFTAVSGLVGIKVSELSRHLSPTDTRRHNFFVLSLCVMRALSKFAPQIEESIWRILERERTRYLIGQIKNHRSFNDLFDSLSTKVKDLGIAKMSGKCNDELEKQTFAVIQEAQNLLESLKK